MKRTYRFILVAVVAFFSLAGKAPDKNKTIVVFVDLSSSVKDLEIYRDAWRKILAKLNPGDRILLGSINDETFTHFRPAADEIIPVFNMLKENKLRYDRKLKEINANLAKKFEETANGPKSQKTDILNSLLLAEKIFRAEKRRPILVILSDMLEDSERYNFERVKITAGFIHQVIEEKRKQKQLPDLMGAKVFVAGASAKTAGKALDVQRFWIEYCKASNGVLNSENYGPSLINFDE
jgi:hypothetical protein